MKYIEYKAPSNSNPLNIVISIIIGSVIAFFLGWFYCVSTLIPIIYFKVLITIGLGFALAFTVQILSKVFIIKDKKSRLIFIGFIVLVAFYSIWIGFIVQTFTEEFPSLKNYADYWILPANLFDNIALINKHGTWGLNFSTAINGITLTIIWIIEAIIIFSIAIGRVYKFPENPFSEKLNKWYPKMILQEEFEPIYSSSRFILNLKEKGTDIIFDLKTGFARKYSEIAVFYLEGEDVQYISINNKFINIKQENKTTVTPVIKPIQISTADARKLITKFSVSKEFYLDF